MKGKHGVASAQRREQLAKIQADKLTHEVQTLRHLLQSKTQVIVGLEAKLEGLTIEISALQNQAATNRDPLILELHSAAEATHAHLIETMKLFREICTREETKLDTEEYKRLRELIGGEAFVAFIGGTRRARRAEQYESSGALRKILRGESF